MSSTLARSCTQGNPFPSLPLRARMSIPMAKQARSTFGRSTELRNYNHKNCHVSSYVILFSPCIITVAVVVFVVVFEFVTVVVVCALLNLLNVRVANLFHHHVLIN